MEIVFLLCAICHRDFASLYHYGLSDEHFVAHEFEEPDVEGV